MTDKCFLFLFGALIVISLPLIIYTLYHSDINRLNGYDDCGNICGHKNEKDPRFPCSGADYTDRPFHNNLTCEEEISLQGSIESIQRKFGSIGRNISSKDRELGSSIKRQVLSRLAGTIAIATLVPLGLTLLLAAGFRYAPRPTVAIATGLPCIILIWQIFRISTIPFIFAGILTVFLCLLIFIRNRIRLALILFGESSVAISNIKMLVPIPLMTLVVSIVVIVISGITYLTMSTAGILQRVPDSTRLDYVKNGWMSAAIFLSLLITAWIIYIMLELQNMAISSAVYKWYASRTPVTTSYSTTLKSHVGSILLESLVVSGVAAPRHFFIILSQFSVFKHMADWFLKYLNGFHYAYIFIAAHGTPFITSSRKMMRLLSLEVSHTSGVKGLGHVVIFLSAVLVIAASILISFLLSSDDIFSKIYVMMCIYFNCIMSLAYCFILLAPIQIAYDTLFFCACEEIMKEGDPQRCTTVKEHLNAPLQILEEKILRTSQPPIVLTTVT